MEKVTKQFKTELLQLVFKSSQLTSKELISAIDHICGYVAELEQKNHALNQWIEGARIDIDGLSSKVETLEQQNKELEEYKWKLNEKTVTLAERLIDPHDSETERFRAEVQRLVERLGLLPLPTSGCFAITSNGKDWYCAATLLNRILDKIEG